MGGNAVKDAQRTKTSESTQRTVSFVWGCQAHAEHVARTVEWYRQLVERAGGVTASCAIQSTSHRRPVWS